MKIQINNAEVLELSIPELYDCWLIDKESFHHWLTRKSNIKIPIEADTGSWFFAEDSNPSDERGFFVDLKDYIDWWNPLVVYIKTQRIDSYRIIDKSIVCVKFEIYLNNYPENYFDNE